MPKAPKWLNDTIESLLSSKMPLLQVTEVICINPHIKKIRLQGDLKGLQFYTGYAIAIRVSDAEYRNYAPAFHDTEAGIIELIAHLHGVAPGARFVDNLKKEDEIRLIPPRGKKMYNETVKQQYFFGDETSLGLACALHYTLKKNRQQYHYYFELDPENWNVPALLGLDNFTIVPKGKTFCVGELVNELSFFQTSGWQNGNFILTGNAQSVQTIRKTLKQHQIAGSILAQAYWAEGKTGL